MHFDRAVALESEGVTTANASLGDVDGDGHLDIVLARGRHWPLVQVVLFNDGKGNFDRRADLNDHADRSYSAILADVDGDGHLDLVVCNDRPDEKRVYVNDGKGRFTLTGTFGDPMWPSRNATVVDLDGDGYPDIVVANRGPSGRTASFVCRNDGTGRFPECRELCRYPASTIAAGDLTGDGLPDLVVPHRDGGQGCIFLNDGSGSFREKRPVGPPDAATRAVALADLTGDGRLDVLLGDESGGIQVHLNRGGLSFEKAMRLGRGTVYAIAVADLTGDGSMDVVLGHRGAPCAAFLNDGSGRSFREIRFGDDRGAVYGLAIGDVDGDGRPDIVAARSEAPCMLYVNSP